MNKIIIIIPMFVALLLIIFPFVVYSGNNVMLIKSTSMLPVLKPNDLIVVEPTAIDQINEGDIISFDSHMKGVGVVAHRVIDVYQKSGQTFLETKGDNAQDPDRRAVTEEDLIGRVSTILPSIGILLVDPVRYSLVAVIVITGVLLLKDVITKPKPEKKS